MFILSSKLARTVYLPVEVGPEKVKAMLKEGILELVLPKVRAVNATPSRSRSASKDAMTSGRGGASRPGLLRNAQPDPDTPQDGG